MPQPFDALRERLLRAGFAPRRVRRYCRELTDHLADLTAGEVAAGRENAEAQAAARARLGSDAALADAMLMRPSLRSWTARAPWAVLVLVPVAIITLAFVGLVMGLMAWRGPEPAALSAPLQEHIRDACWFAALKLPMILSVWVAVMAARQRLPARWPMLGVLGIACASAALRAHVLWPGHDLADPARWSIELSVLPSPLGAVWLGRFRETGLIALALGLMTYWGVRVAASGGPRPDGPATS